MWTMRHVQFVLFTTKLTKDMKGSDILNSELRALRITIVKNLRGLAQIFQWHPENTRQTESYREGAKAPRKWGIYQEKLLTK